MSRLPQLADLEVTVRPAPPAPTRRKLTDLFPRLPGLGHLYALAIVATMSLGGLAVGIVAGYYFRAAVAAVRDDVAVRENGQQAARPAASGAANKASRSVGVISLEALGLGPNENARITLAALSDANVATLLDHLRRNRLSWNDRTMLADSLEKELEAQIRWLATGRIEPMKLHAFKVAAMELMGAVRSKADEGRGSRMLYTTAAYRQARGDVFMVADVPDSTDDGYMVQRFD